MNVREDSVAELVHVLWKTPEIFNQETKKPTSAGWTKFISGLPPHSFLLFFNYFFSCWCSILANLHCNRGGLRSTEGSPRWHWRDTWPEPAGFGHHNSEHSTELFNHSYTGHLLNGSFRKQQRTEATKTWLRWENTDLIPTVNQTSPGKSRNKAIRDVGRHPNTSNFNIPFSSFLLLPVSNLVV